MIEEAADGFSSCLCGNSNVFSDPDKVAVECKDSEPKISYGIQDEHIGHECMPKNGSNSSDASLGKY